MVCSLGGDFQENSKLGFQAENSKLFLRPALGTISGKTDDFGAKQKPPAFG